MIKRGLIVLAMIGLAGCATDFEAVCARAGFEAGTAAFAQCIAYKEAEKERWRAEALRYHGRGSGGGGV